MLYLYQRVSLQSFTPYPSLSPLLQVFFPHHRQERMREDQAVWLRRPLPESLLEAAVKNVVYLRELREKQLEAMMNSFVRCVDVFLETVRDGDAEDAAAAPVSGRGGGGRFVGLGMMGTVTEERV